MIIDDMIVVSNTDDMMDDDSCLTDAGNYPSNQEVQCLFQVIS